MRAQVQAVPTGARARDAGANDATARSSAADLQKKQTGAAKTFRQPFAGWFARPPVSLFPDGQSDWLAIRQRAAQPCRNQTQGGTAWVKKP